MALESVESWNFTGAKNAAVPQLNESHHVKLWIGTVKKLPRHPSQENTAQFAGKLVNYVDITGTVVDRVSYGKADVYICTFISFRYGKTLQML